MKKEFLLPLLGLAIACSSPEEDIPSPESNNNQIPVPTQVVENMADEKAYEEKREAYFDLIHSSSDPVDWKAVNQSNFEEKAAERALKLQTKAIEIFADGAIQAEWQERGSKDVPGNIRVVDLHIPSSDIYAISDGGILWKGNLDGETWIPQNDFVQLDRKVIQVIDLPDDTRRILAAQAHIIVYSDDEGETWTNAVGLSGVNGTAINLDQLNDDGETMVYLYNSNLMGGPTQNRVAYSTDHGETWTSAGNLSYGSSVYASMDVAHNSNTAYILDGNSRIYSFSDESLSLITDELTLDGDNRCMVQVNETGGVVTLYALMDNSSLFKSEDEGLSFDYVNDLATSSWGVGFELSETNPDILYYGEVNLYRSDNGGESWDLVSEWWEYYGDVANKIHADIMSIEPYVLEDGSEVTLIPNHGGINASYNYLISTPNIAMTDLNTGQFYDVLSDPDNPALIYGGTQDQGFQRTLDGDSPDPSSFEQVISGDYGEMQFTSNAQTIWIQYPGAWFQIYPNAATDDGYSYEFDINGSNMPNVNWIVPTVAAPYPSDNYIYAAGGALDGGAGSHLIKLTFDGGSVSGSEYEFDFYASSGASISAIETTALDDQMIYVVTENGRFYRSENQGDDFIQTESYIGPSGGWIYTADIFASRLTPGLVFVGGSGYAGASVYMSTDSAKTFIGLEGLPNTMVHEMVMDPAEKYLFAATDAGPYVYSIEAEEWFDIGGVTAPLQQYISVEFLPEPYGVRFATWGRGIWDFNMVTTASIEETEALDINTYPNPSSNGFVTLDTPEGMMVELCDMNGKMILSSTVSSGKTTVDLSFLPNGTYLLVGFSESGKKVQKKIQLMH